MIEIKDIKPMLSGIKVNETPEKELKIYLLAVIKKAFMLYGAYKFKTKEELDFEVKEIAKQLYSDFRNKPILSNMRIPEIDACIVWGVQGELSSVKSNDLNYKIIFNWVKTYSESDVRIDSIKSYEQDKNSNLLRLGQSNEISEAEQNRMMEDAINASYRNYLRDPESEILDFSSQVSKSIYQRQGQKSGQIRDLGGAKINFLIRKKIIQNNEDLRSFYDRLKKEGKEAVFNG